MAGFAFESTERCRAEAKGADPKIEITSFGPVDSHVTRRLAEVCGKVTGVEGDFTPVRIIPDYDSSNPANYMTFVVKDGNFCQVVMTLYGTVSGELAGAGAKAKVSTTAKMTQVLNP